AKDSNKPMYVALQSVPTGSTRANVSIYWKPINSTSDIDSPSDFQTGWTQFQVSSTTSAYSTMTLDNSGNIAFLYEENGVSNNGGCYDIQFKSLSLETITSQAYTYTTATTEAHRTAFLADSEIGESGEVKDKWEGKIVTLKAKVVKDDTTYDFYLHNEGLNLKTETTKPSLSDYSYYWVISKNPETGYYYLSSYKGDGYLGKGYGRDYSVEDETAEGAYKNNIPVCTDDYTQAFEIVEFSKSGSVNSGYTGETMTGYALKFVHNTNYYRWVAVSEDGAINWFDHTALGETTSFFETTYWATDFEINVVGEVDTPDTYGTWDSPTHFGFPVKLARSDDDKAVVEAEDYNYYATLKLPFAVTLPEGVTAYKITETKNKENEEVGLEQLTLTDNILPYETPVLLSIAGGEGESYPVSKTIYLQAAKHQTIQDTGFKGSLGMKTFTNEEYNPNDKANFFILGKKNGRVAFYYLSNQVLAANKAYYVYNGSTSAKTLTFSFQDTPSAIGMPEVEGADVTNAPIFDLAGRRITGEASRGVYIRNGKKFVVR
ncbi:MAG: sialidase family protein, partial [Prevotella sp.]|nr:sialidase family protein [Prevotella sp.]